MVLSIEEYDRLTIQKTAIQNTSGSQQGRNTEDFMPNEIESLNFGVSCHVRCPARAFWCAGREILPGRSEYVPDQTFVSLGEELARQGRRA